MNNLTSVSLIRHIKLQLSLFCNNDIMIDVQRVGGICLMNNILLKREFLCEFIRVFFVTYLTDPVTDIHKSVFKIRRVYLIMRNSMQCEFFNTLIKSVYIITYCGISG